MFKRLLKSKTFWTGIAGMLGAVSGYFTGEIEVSSAIQIGLGSIMAIFIRDGIEKKGTN